MAWGRHGQWHLSDLIGNIFPVPHPLPYTEEPTIDGTIECCRYLLDTIINPGPPRHFRLLDWLEIFNSAMTLVRSLPCLTVIFCYAWFSFTIEVVTLLFVTREPAETVQGTNQCWDYQ